MTQRAAPAPTPKKRESKRRERKYEREKRRRDVVAQQFTEICTLLGIEVGAADRTYVLNELLLALKKKNELQNAAPPQQMLKEMDLNRDTPSAAADHAGRPDAGVPLQRRRASSIGALVAAGAVPSIISPSKHEDVDDLPDALGADAGPLSAEHFDYLDPQLVLGVDSQIFDDPY